MQKYNFKKVISLIKIPIIEGKYELIIGKIENSISISTFLNKIIKSKKLKSNIKL